MLPNKGNKFNIDNDFDEDDEEDNDSMNDSGFNSAPMMGNNGNSNNARNGNNVMFLDDLFGSNMHNNGHDRSNPSMFGFQGFNGNNQHFNALSSASSYSNQQLNNGTDPTADHKADDSAPKASTNDRKTSSEPSVAVNANQTAVV